MNTDPEVCDLPPEKRMHKARPFVITAILLILLGILYFLTSGFGNGLSTKGDGDGSGHSNEGAGPGSGKTGDGPGSGKKGSGPGSGKSGQGTGKGKSGFGIGSGPKQKKISIDQKGQKNTSAPSSTAEKKTAPESQPVKVEWESKTESSPEDLAFYNDSILSIKTTSSPGFTLKFPKLGAKGTSVADEGTTVLIKGFFKETSPKGISKIKTYAVRMDKKSHRIADIKISE